MRLTLALIALVAAICDASPARAATLADKLSSLINENSFFFQGANLDSLTPALERIAIQGTDLPATSTVPGVTYVFDPELGVPVRSSGSLGPVFLERAETVGRHQVLLGLSYLHADLDQLDGHDAASGLFFQNSAPAVDTNTGEPLRIRNRLTFQELAIHLNEVSVSATYGITDDWDANVLLPLVETALDTEARSQNFTVHADGSVVPDRPTHLALHDDAFGVGDLLLRTKYRVARTRLVDVAAGLTLRAPTGTTGDFHGIGDWTVTPAAILSREFGHHELHANVGVECNAGDLTRSRVRYGIGATIQPTERFAGLIDVLGSSGVADDKFSQDGVAIPTSRFNGPFQTGPAIAGSDGSVHFTSVVPRTDIVDLALGVKGTLVGRLIGFVTVILPLTNDGLRADVIPAGGIEYTF